MRFVFTARVQRKRWKDKLFSARVVLVLVVVTISGGYNMVPQNSPQDVGVWVEFPVRVDDAELLRKMPGLAARQRLRPGLDTVSCPASLTFR